MDAFNWEHHHQIMQDVISFLEDHSLTPSQLNIQADGWAEAIFVTPKDQPSMKHIWYRMKKKNRVEIDESLLEIDTGEIIKLRVKFRITEHQSTWRRIWSYRPSLRAVSESSTG